MMLKFLALLFDGVAPALKNHLWQSTFFLLLAALLALALRRNYARARYWLWLAASLKFLVPFALLVALGSHINLPHRPAAPAQTGIYVAVDEFSEPFVPGVDAPVAVPPAAPSATGWELEHVLPRLLAAVWFAGFAIVLCVWAVYRRRVSVAVRHAVPIGEGRELAALRRLERAAGVTRGIEIRMVIPGSTLRDRTLRLRSGQASGTQIGVMEPGIFGIVRPVLIWPAGMSERLDDAHLEAILAHEVCHVRRRDNLTAALHMLVEAVFWFHPLVWWLGARLVEERERACDEEVLRLCNRPEVYAEGILKVCEFCLESPLPCVSGVTGSDLKKRIMNVLAAHVTLRLGPGKKVLLVAAGLMVVAVPIVLGQAQAARRMMLAAVDAAPRPFRTAAHAMIAEEKTPSDGETATPPAQGAVKPFQFDVVSIRPADPDLRPKLVSFQFTDDGFVATNQSLVMTLLFQYQSELQLDSSRIVGGPDWARTLVWNIRAKVADSDIAEWSRLSHGSSASAKERRRATIQAMLADRFKLKTHFETRQGTVYALVVARGGLKIRQSTSDGPPQMDIGKGHAGNLSIQRAEIGALAPFFAQELGHPVIDKTGLTGKYDLTLDWAPAGSAAAESSGGAASSDASAPSIITAIEEQLGLKLESQKGPVEHLVIDHAEKPSVDGAEVPAASLMPVALVQEKTAQAGVVVSAGPGAAAVGVMITPEEAAIAESIQFDVASFRVNKTNQPGPTFEMPSDGDGFTTLNRPMRDLIRFAYNVTSGVNFHFANEPAWINDVKWDIRAKVAPEDLAKWQKLSNAARTLVLRRFCVEQLKLKFHPDMTPYTYYNLVVDKKGPKMAEAKPGDNTSLPYLRAVPEASVRWMGPGLILAHAGTMPMLAVVLSGHTPYVVHDETGLTGNYNFMMSYAPGTMDDPRARALGAPPMSASPDDDRPSIFTAVEQLGLKLVATKGPLEGIVIDHVEMPPEN